MKKRMCIWMLAFVFTLSMVSLTLAQEKPKVPAWQTTVVKEWVANAKAAVKSVTIQDVKGAIDNEEKAVILDVRDPQEYAAGHIPGAINISRGLLELDIWDKVPDRNSKIYVYCPTGIRSALATKTLNDMGYKDALVTDPGYAAWVKAGYPVEK